MKKGIKIALIMAIASIIVALINNNIINSEEEKSQIIHQVNDGENSQNFGIVNWNIFNY